MGFDPMNRVLRLGDDWRLDNARAGGIDAGVGAPARGATLSAAGNLGHDRPFSPCRAVRE
jgi:hypothetical protein